MWLLYALAGIAVLAAMSAGLALGLHLLAPAMAERKRTLLAAGLATLLPMGIAFGGFFTEADIADDEFLLAFGALVVTTIAIFSVACLPPAWFATSRLARGEAPQPLLPQDGEPELIEG